MSLFSDRTYENLMEEALSRVSDIYDKREGSMIFNGNAPCLAEMAQVYIAIDFLLESTYIHSAPREFLIKRAKDHGIYPNPATSAVFKAEFNIDVPIGTRFSVDDLNFAVKEKVTDEIPSEEDTVFYLVKCETVGKISNDYSGRMLPIEYVNGLTKANLLECVIAGENEEDTEVFRARVLEALKSIAFGGNRADYRNWVMKVPGVEAVKVYPVWNGDITPASLIPSQSVASWYEGIMDSLSADVKAWLSAVYSAAKDKKLTVGGTVKVVVMGAENITTAELISSVQEEIDPTESAGEGKGIAPIGHVVTVSGAVEETINIQSEITVKNGTFESIKSNIEDVIDDYFAELKGDWEDSERLTVRISHIESRILTKLSDYIEDIRNTLINGVSDNYILEKDAVPVLGEVTNSEG